MKKSSILFEDDTFNYKLGFRGPNEREQLDLKSVDQPYENAHYNIIDRRFTQIKVENKKRKKKSTLKNVIGTVANYLLIYAEFACLCRVIKLLEKS